MKFNMDESIGFVINKTSQAIKKEFSRRLKAYDLTPEQWSALNRLGEEDGLTQKDLAERTYKDSPNTTRIIDKLEKKGLLQRREDPEDRRAFQIFLTESGKSLREQIIPVASQLNVDVTDGLDKKDLSQLLQLMNRIYANLD